MRITRYQHHGVSPRLTGAALAAGLTAVAAPAAAFCPATPEDARAGFVVLYDDDTSMASRLMPDGLQHDTETYRHSPGEGYFTRGLYAVFLVEETPMENGELLVDERWLFAYPGGLDSLPEIVPGLRWEGTATFSDAEGNKETWHKTVTAGALMPVTHSGCRMRVIPVVLRSTDADDFTDFLLYEYVPALGMSLFRGYSDSGEPDADDIMRIVGFAPYTAD